MEELGGAAIATYGLLPSSGCPMSEGSWEAGEARLWDCWTAGQTGQTGADCRAATLDSNGGIPPFISELPIP